MARPESINEIEEENRFVRLAMFELDRIMTDAALLKHYTALLEVVTKMGGRADKAYSTIDLDIPKNKKQLEDQLRSDQYNWDETQKLYRIALKGDSSDEPIREYQKTTIKEWAKREGLPDPFDVFAANDEDIQKLRKEMGLDEGDLMLSLRELQKLANEQEKTFNKMCEYINTRAIGLVGRVDTFKKHPSYDSRADLKIAMHELDGMFNMALAMNKYEPLNNGVREQVTNARRAVESLYKK